MNKYTEKHFVVTPAQMKAAEGECEHRGTSCAVLMENVGAKIAERLDEMLSLSGKTVVILAGSGNNGGDGFALARRVSERGARAEIVIAGAMPKTELAKDSYQRNMPFYASVTSYESNLDAVFALLDAADIIADCVYGTGFHGELSEGAARLFDYCNNLECFKCSADIASGCNALDGEADNSAFSADCTFALGAVKTGQLYAPCSEKSGEIILLDIGISPECYSGGCSAVLCDEELLRLFPKRKRISHKGTFGRLLNVAGSESCIGAAWLSTNAALRTGAGLVTLASVNTVTACVSVNLHECVLLPLGAEKNIKAAEIDTILSAAKGATAISVGCGMGNSGDTYAVVDALIKNTDCPIVIDADGINSLAPHINGLRDNTNRLILTPHPKEFCRISGYELSYVLKNKLKAAADFAREHGVHLILKDAYSVYAAPDGFTAVNMSGNAALAKGGSGDTLTGTVAGLLAQGMAIPDAVRLGMYLFGCAAELAAKSRGMCGILPSELPELYPYILKD